MWKNKRFIAALVTAALLCFGVPNADVIAALVAGTACQAIDGGCL